MCTAAWGEAGFVRPVCLCLGMSLCAHTLTHVRPPAKIAASPVLCPKLC